MRPSAERLRVALLAALVALPAGAAVTITPPVSTASPPAKAATATPPAPARPDHATRKEQRAAAETLLPFHATYTTSLNGMPLGADLNLDLVRGATGLWSLRFSAKGMLFDFAESSEFTWEGCRSTPQRYRFDFHGFGVDRSLHLDFDQQKQLATGLSRRGPVSFKMPRKASDELSLAFVARCELVGGKQETELKAATTRGIRTFNFRVAGRETIKVPAGSFETVRILRVRPEGDTRESILWVAPALDYVPVKLEHQEKLGMRGIVQLKTYTDGKRRIAAP
jgi:hypothetical protein